MLSKVYVSSDHTGVILKAEIKSYLENLGYTVCDYGCDVVDVPVDYPDYVSKVAKSVVTSKDGYGILICGTGIGMSIAANRYYNIRAALCYSEDMAYYARRHNDANVLCIGSRYIDINLAKSILDKFLSTGFSFGRHTKRLNKLLALDSTVDDNEVRKFSVLAEEWWNENGKFKPLHMINPMRSQYILTSIREKFSHDLESLSLLDIGCGGGLLSEAMSRSKIKVTGIDVSEENIKVAKLHADQVNLKIDYFCQSVEEFSLNNIKYDVITVMEVVEHVRDLSKFMKCVCGLLKEGGILFISTLNRNIKSWIYAIVMAEYILKWLPRKTHDWRKFIKPSEIVDLLSNNGLLLQEIVGMEYSIADCEWKITDNISVNYIVRALK